MQNTKYNLSDLYNWFAVQYFTKKQKNLKMGGATFWGRGHIYFDLGSPTEHISQVWSISDDNQ